MHLSTFHHPKNVRPHAAGGSCEKGIAALTYGVGRITAERLSQSSNSREGWLPSVHTAGADPKQLIQGTISE